MPFDDKHSLRMRRDVQVVRSGMHVVDTVLGEKQWCQSRIIGIRCNGFVTGLC